MKAFWPSDLEAELLKYARHIDAFCSLRSNGLGTGRIVVAIMQVHLFANRMIQMGPPPYFALSITF